MVNWTTFESLPGSVTNNFEMLCRSLVWLTYSRYGSFRAQLNQPGVEFDLKLKADCSLGREGTHFGWQCRWYELSKGVRIGKTRREKIKDALDKTIKTIPNITDWVLWTRYPLTKADQEWFHTLSNDIKLHLWTVHEAEMLLGLDGELLKQTYFGDLILTPEQLLIQHEQSIAPIKKRWFPEVHQIVDAERSVQRMLGNSNAWDELKTLSVNLMEYHSQIQDRIVTVPKLLKSMTDEFLDCVESYSSQLKFAFELLASGAFALLHEVLPKELQNNLEQIASLPRKLRGARLQVGLLATNAIAELREADWLLSEITKFLSTRMVAVVADAGGGKTQLAATLTAASENRPAGVLLLGRLLKHNISLDDLARNIVVNGKPIPSMQALLAALNAAAERSKSILPLVIDGLNEAEDPREWKSLLGSLNAILKQFPNVLIICTLRSGAKKKETDDSYYGSMENRLQPFVENYLPDNTISFTIPDFGDDIGEAMERYFSFFNIDARHELPYKNFLRHPLTLRIFCEVANPNREKTVGMESIPRTLASLFEKYVELAAMRIEELSPYYSRLYQADIINHVDKFGEFLWTNRSRGINEKQFRIAIGDDGKPWNNSVINFMEQEGLLLRMPGKFSEADEIVPTYDLLGGYFIAKYIISRNGRDTITRWLKKEPTVKLLANSYASQHPLRDDIMQFLVALLPKYHNIQLWEIVDPTLKDEALELAILLERKYLDKATIEAIGNVIKESRPGQNRYFGRLYGIHDSDRHPLNATFLKEILFEMTPSSRDLIWTEWIRRNESHFQSELDNIIYDWSSNCDKRITSDFLSATWLMWMLSSTSHKLRHKATLGLYWYGRGDAGNLFDLTIESLAINDPYIPERMLAASYGAAMALTVQSGATEFCDDLLSAFARKIYEEIWNASAEKPFTHVLIIDYARGIIELAHSRKSSLFNNKELKDIYRTNKPTRKLKAVKSFIEKVERGQSPFRMDFENYVIGRLVSGRRNYDYNNEQYKNVRSKILARIFDLGWSYTDFVKVESAIENSRNSYSRHDETITKIDRYGKKYSWIAYYEQKGLQDQVKKVDDSYLDRRESDADIDPSFPEPLNEQKIINLDLLGNSDISLQEWIKVGKIPDLSVYVEKDILHNNSGPWILLDGYIGQEDERRGRSMFGFFRSFFVKKEDEAELLSLLEKQSLGGRWLPEKMEVNSAFAGEIPWSKHFIESQPNSLSFVVSENIIEVLEEEEKFYLNGIALDLSFFNQLRLSGINFEKIGDEESFFTDDVIKNIEVRKEPVKVKKVEQKTKEIKVIQPVCDVSTLGQTLFKSSIGGRTLTKEICQMLNLTAIPQTRDLQTYSFERATFQNAFENGSFKNSEHLFFLRKDLLDSLLEKLGMSLVWAIWGERELSLGQFEVWDRKNSGENASYADFQQIYAYSSLQKK